MNRYRITADYDYDTERPDSYGIGRIVSFSTRHVMFEHPDTYTIDTCPDCRGDGYGPDDSECSRCEGLGTVPIDLIDHPDVLAVLSYYEHGASKWMVGDSTAPDYGGFDTVNVAGVIVWNDELGPEERGSWGALPEETQQSILEQLVDSFTEWANGNCFRFRIERLDSCMECGSTLASDAGIEDPGYGGIIGGEYLIDSIRDALHEYGIDPKVDQFEYAGEARFYIEDEDWGPR